MANFSEKVLCLFDKTKEQIFKEAARRGIPIYTSKNNYKSRNYLVAEIIYKDAYDCGREVAKSSCACSNHTAPTTTDYLIEDNYRDQTYKISITEEQKRLLDWLNEKGLFGDMFYSRWEQSYEDCGKI